MIPESFFQFENPFSIKLGENRRRSKLQHTTYITSRHTSIAGSGNSFNGFPNKHLTQNIDTTYVDVGFGLEGNGWGQD